MKLYTIDNRIRQFFVDMDPFTLLSLDTAGKTTALGAFITEANEKGEEGDIPVAMTILTETEDAIVIQWLYVAHEYRGRGYGDELLYEIFQFASKLGRDTVRAHFFKLFGRDNVCGGEELYFIGHGFIREASDNPRNYYYAANVKDVLNETPKVNLTFEDLMVRRDDSNFYDALQEGESMEFMLSQLADKPIFRRTVGLQQITPIAKESLITLIGQLQECRNAKCMGIMKELDENLDLTELDMDISCIICPRKTVECILLVAHPEEDVIMPILFRSMSAINNAKLVLLLQYAIQKASAKYPPKTRVIIRIVGDKYMNAVEKLLEVAMR